MEIREFYLKQRDIAESKDEGEHGEDHLKENLERQNGIGKN